jgi:4,5-DOPA dioxygenase extradiol
VIRLPAVFFGHGSPMNAIEDNGYTEAWARLGRELPRPRAVLAISAHWYGPGTHVTAMERPPTIHDFGNFPRALHEFEYPAPGDPVLAARVAELLAPLPVAADERWGLDHGTWSVLTHVYPDADVPVVQLSLDENQPPEFHYALGERLAPLRDEGVLVIASGNVVHNLDAFRGPRPVGDDWAGRFERRVRELAAAGDGIALTRFEQLGPEARLAVPTPEHYLPLLPILGTRRADEPVTFPTEGTVGGALSMLSVRVG